MYQLETNHSWLGQNSQKCLDRPTLQCCIRKVFHRRLKASLNHQTLINFMLAPHRPFSDSQHVAFSRTKRSAAFQVMDWQRRPMGAQC